MPEDNTPDPIPAAIVRPADHVRAVRAQSLAEMGSDGRTALAWNWALTGTAPSPISLSLSPGHPPSRDQIVAEADASPEGSTAPPGVPTDACDQLGEARRVLSWLAGSSDEIPVDADNRGLLIGARDNYARTDDQIRQVRDQAIVDLDVLGRSGIAGQHAAARREPTDCETANTAWLRGVRDLLDWVLGDRPTSPLAGHDVAQPTVYDLSFEESAARDSGECMAHDELAADEPTVNRHYGAAILIVISWLRGETRFCRSETTYNTVSEATPEPAS